MVKNAEQTLVVRGDFEEKIELQDLGKSLEVQGNRLDFKCETSVREEGDGWYLVLSVQDCSPRAKLWLIAYTAGYMARVRGE